MKRTASLFCGVLAVALTTTAWGQLPGGAMGAPGGYGPTPTIGAPPVQGGYIDPSMQGAPIEGSYLGPQMGEGPIPGGYIDPAACGPYGADEYIPAEGFVDPGGSYSAAAPGRLFGSKRFLKSMAGTKFFAVNLADNGLGFGSSYISLGAKMHFGEDFLRGRWTFEPRGGINLDDGGGIGSFGLERHQTINSMFSDVSMGVWLDIDGDTQGSFGRTMTQLGFTGKIRRGKFLLQSNVYLPIGNDVTNLGNGRFDTAMTGIDAFIGLPAPKLQMNNVRIDLGGYFYADEDQLGPLFGGFKARVNAVGYGGLHYIVEMNTDNVNGFTGIASIVGVFGGHGAYSDGGNDLLRTLRNEHIVRIHRE